MDLMDIEELNTLSHETILELLNRRYMKDEIYTWASRTLVAINPYKQLDNYYCQETQQQLYDSDKPHIYSIAENALSTIKQVYAGSSDASIIVSGESGSGKTESTKHLLRYLTVLTSQLSSHQQQASHIEQHILAVNPVLEAFGNARTSCNDNSSRFGKYVVLQYDSMHCLVGAHIQAYMLEKTRVVYQGFGNSNFHIFYQFLTGLTEDERRKYLVPGCDIYTIATSSHNDCKAPNWMQTVSALKEVGFTEEDLNHIYSIIGAILCLGNIAYTISDDDRVEVEEPSLVYVSKSSSLLGIRSQSLEKVLLFRCISASHARRKSVFYKPCTADEAKARRDCLAKLLYDRLFCWLVEKINSSIKCEEYSNFIGLLDIYGFELFQVNSLEQLCINYANERLQHYFIEHYLNDLQSEYEEEGIAWQHISVPSDNVSCVQLMSGTSGLFSILNEECQLNRLKSEDNMTERFVSSGIAAHPNIRCTQKDVMNRCFSISHYAGSVTYSSESLVEKNKDVLPADIIDTLDGSSYKLVCNMVIGLNSTQKPKQQKKTVLSKFKSSLDELLEMLRRTECQYIRCIKPNKQAKPATLDAQYVDRQLKACGVMETVKIRSQAHSFRFRYEDFLSTYEILHSRSRCNAPDDKENEIRLTPCSARLRRRTLLPSAELNMSVSEAIDDSIPKQPSTPVKSFAGKKRCTTLLLSVIGPSVMSLVSFGISKLFIKNHSVIESLESARLRRLSSCAFTIQCAFRKYQNRKYRQLLNHCSLIITRAMKRIVQQKRAQRFRSAAITKIKTDKCTYPAIPAENGLNNVEKVYSKVDDLRQEVVANTSITKRILFKKPGLVSIRRVSNLKVSQRFHVRASTLLRNSHIPSLYDYHHCCLTDCFDLHDIR